MPRWREPVNWRRLAVMGAVAVMGTYIGFLIITSYVAVQLAGGMSETWARVYLMICQMDGRLPAACVADPALRWGFSIGIGIMFSVAAIPVIMLLLDWRKVK